MLTLCLVEVTQLCTEAVDGRQRYFQTRNKSNDYFESLQFRQDLFIITHYHKRENISLAIHVVQKITIIHAQKIGKFVV